jgi:hypothetical protein
MDKQETLQEIYLLRRDALRILAKMVTSDRTPAIVKLQAARYIIDTLLVYDYASKNGSKGNEVD